MKQFLLLICLLPLVSILAQESDAKATFPKNNLRIDPLRTVLSDEELYRWQISYERSISDKISVLMGYEKGQFEVGTIRSNFIPTEEYTIKGNSFLAEGRYYFDGTVEGVQEGFFVGAYYKQYWLTELNRNSIDESQSFEKEHALSVVGIDVGYKFAIKYFLFEPIAGYGVASSTQIGKDNRINSSFGNFQSADYTPRIGLNIGVYF